jgi:RNA polymerase sigma-70 factor (ECF subfamily)
MLALDHNRPPGLPIPGSKDELGADLNATQREVLAPPPFEVVFADHSRFAWRLLIRMGVQERDAADVCQEVFLVVHRRLPDFDSNQGSIRAWLSGICLRAASDYRRRSPSRREVLDERLLPPALADGPEADLETRRAWQKLSNVLDDMDTAKRQVFVLFELEAIPMHEVTVILDCPLQTAYSRLHAARRLVLRAFESEREP